MTLTASDVCHIALGLSLALWGLAVAAVASHRLRTAACLLGASCGLCGGIGLAALALWVAG